jgi:ubiquinone biosynthesis protein COQ9
MTDQTPEPTLSDRLLDAALLHVPFDGWSRAAFDAAVADTGIDPALALALFPRRGVDMALAWHRRGDAQMVAALAASNLDHMRLRERVAHAIRLRLDGTDREAVRRGMALLALPAYAGEGARAMWQTADAIWTALGDTSQDGNWYTKRALLSGVYGSTVLYWLGDTSEGAAETWAFLDRRIAGVMQFEKAKAQVENNAFLRAVFALPRAAMAAARKPDCASRSAPGIWQPGQPGAGVS